MYINEVEELFINMRGMLCVNASNSKHVERTFKTFSDSKDDRVGLFTLPLKHHILDV
ncbi:diguanylate cyclase [Vibrio vulnificus]|nr:diguanylate cyclase [Vibrio vulnificus]